MPKENSQPRRPAHRVVVIVDENSNPFEMGCATEVFGLDRPELGGMLYDFQLCAPESVIRMRDGFFSLTAVADLSAADGADTLIVPNRPNVDVPRRREVLDAIRRAHDRGARLIGFCSGAFTLAEAGVLDGRRVTAHWQWADSFRQRFPAVTFEEAVLFVDDGDILTAAGSAAALDLGLHVVRLDHGAEVANSVSRRLVFNANRDGGQKQFIEQPVPSVAEDSMAVITLWALAHLSEPITVADLARRAHISVATLHRRFVAQLNTTPYAWLNRERVRLACRLIERGDLDLNAVAAASGVGTTTTLRTLMRRETGLTPSAYRQRFSAI
ncbi:helix-turn-helix domain-containing protein [Rhodococcus sp. G-MC3]|uniref:GlxA family transcriptional regulator n=1 Tax=Rhodococcus sp. G-MC3 TaxID=3046209 RepID=UPI0024B9354B|nr:helix-turn-helix domain-containing protein [Rhodococcus sp. G-MC3]MDJ0395656.1 helix-turn-helix domain-containing protein [Rhodococcus sp. G-MC3]